MENIGTRITVEDAASTSFAKISSAISDVITHFHNLHSSSTDVFDASEARAYSSAMDKVGREVDQVGEEMARANNQAKQFSNEVVNRVGNAFGKTTSKVSNFTNRFGSSITNLKSKVSSFASGLSSKIPSALNNGINKWKQFNQKIQESNNSAKSLKSTITGLVSAIGGVYAVKSVLDMSTQMTNTKARLDLINDGLQTTEELLQYVANSANESYGDLMTTADAVVKFFGQSGGTFSSVKEAVDFTNQLNKHFIIAGTSAQGVESAVYQLTQSLARGYMDGEDFRNIMEAAQPIIGLIADEMGVGVAELKEMASEGKITGSVIKNAVLGAVDETNKKFEQMPNSFEDIWTVFKNKAVMAFQSVWDEMEDFFNGDTFQSSLDSMIALLKNVAKAAVEVFSWFVKIYDFIADNWTKIAPWVTTIATAFLIWKGAILLVNTALALQKIAIVTSMIAQGVAGVVKAIFTGGSVAAAIALYAEEAAAYAATGAMWGLSAATTAALWPLLIIIGVIILIILAVYAVVWAVNYFADTSISATGIIMGAFYVLGSFIWNLLVSLWNGIVNFAEFLCNVFIHPTWAIKRLFADLIIAINNMFIALLEPVDDTVTSLLNGIIDGINWCIDQLNDFISSCADVLAYVGIEVSTIDRLDNLDSAIARIEQDNLSMEEWVGPEPEGAFDFSGAKLDYWNPYDAANSGYALGQKIDDKVGGFFNGDMFKLDDLTGTDVQKELEQLMKDMEGVTDGLDDGKGGKGSGSGSGSDGGSGGSGLGDGKDYSDVLNEIADNTADTSALEYLIDVAKNKVIERITPQNVTIKMNVSNNVDNQMDLDGVVTYITDRLEEAMYSGAEGVHY